MRDTEFEEVVGEIKNIVEGISNDPVRRHELYREMDLQSQIYMRLYEYLATRDGWRIFNNLRMPELEGVKYVDMLVLRDGIPLIAIEIKMWQPSCDAIKKDISKLRDIMEEYPSVKRCFFVMFDHPEVDRFNVCDRRIEILHYHMTSKIDPISELFLDALDRRQINNQYNRKKEQHVFNDLIRRYEQRIKGK